MTAVVSAGTWPPSGSTQVLEPPAGLAGVADPQPASPGGRSCPEPLNQPARSATTWVEIELKMQT